MELKLPKEVRRIKTGNLFIIGALGIMFAYLYFTGGLDQMTQLVLGGVLVLVFLMSMRSSAKEPITEELAKEIALNRAVKDKQEGKLGVGAINSQAQCALRKSNIGGETVLDSWDVCVQVNDPLKSQYVYSLNPFTGAIEKTFGPLHNWRAEKEPDKVFVEPPSVFEWIRREREARKEIEKTSGG